MLIRLDQSNAWPEDISRRVRDHADLLRRYLYMDELISEEPFRSIAEDLDTFIRLNRILGYHCTREPEEGYFRSRGLRVLDLRSHQQEFLDHHGHQFTPEELSELQARWDLYFTSEMSKSRNGMIWFCFAPDQVLGPGAEPLFEYFGGEAVSMPIDENSTIATKLRNIGRPVVVEVSLDPMALQTFSNVPFAFNALSIHHWRLNPEVVISGREGYLRHAVPAEEIIAVTPRDMFFQEHSSVPRSV